MLILIYTDNISCRTDALIRKYKTRDPFELCDALGIRIRLKDLGTAIKAYYFCQSRIRNIVLNTRSGETVQRVLCAHELGHAVLHGELAAMRGFSELELFDATSRTEYEANMFAAELLIDNGELSELLADGESSFFTAAGKLYVPAELLDFKLRIMKSKGYRIEAPYIARSDFLKEDIPGCFGQSR